MNKSLRVLRLASQTVGIVGRERRLATTDMYIQTEVDRASSILQGYAFAKNVKTQVLKEELVSALKSNVANSKITDDGLRFLQFATKLEYLFLGGCTRITDNGLKYLHSCEYLRELDLSDCCNITVDGIANLMNGVDATMPPTQTTTTDGTREPNLKGLRPGGLTPQDLNLVGGKRQYLKTLSLARCTDITNTTLRFLEQCGIESLDLFGCTQINAQEQSLKTMTSLKSVVIDCENIPANALCKKLKRLFSFDQLTDLHIHNCKDLTAVNLKQVLPSQTLISLVITECPNFDPSRMNFPPSLRKLLLDHCSKITNEKLIKILKECANLKQLYLSSCAQLEDSIVATIKGSQSLTSARMYGCTKISEEIAKRSRTEPPLWDCEIWNPDCKITTHSNIIASYTDSKRHITNVAHMCHSYELEYIPLVSWCFDTERILKRIGQGIRGLTLDTIDWQYRDHMHDIIVQKMLRFQAVDCTCEFVGAIALALFECDRRWLERSNRGEPWSADDMRRATTELSYFVGLAYKLGLPGRDGLHLYIDEVPNTFFGWFKFNYVSSGLISEFADGSYAVGHSAQKRAASVDEQDMPVDPRHKDKIWMDYSAVRHFLYLFLSKQDLAQIFAKDTYPIVKDAGNPMPVNRMFVRAIQCLDALRWKDVPTDEDAAGEPTMSRTAHGNMIEATHCSTLYTLCGLQLIRMTQGLAAWDNKRDAIFDDIQDSDNLRAKEAAEDDIRTAGMARASMHEPSVIMRMQRWCTTRYALTLQDPHYIGERIRRRLMMALNKDAVSKFTYSQIRTAVKSTDNDSPGHTWSTQPYLYASEYAGVTMRVVHFVTFTDKTEQAEPDPATIVLECEEYNAGNLHITSIYNDNNAKFLPATRDRVEEQLLPKQTLTNMALSLAREIGQIRRIHTYTLDNNHAPPGDDTQAHASAYNMTEQELISRQEQGGYYGTWGFRPAVARLCQLAGFKEHRIQPPGQPVAKQQTVLETNDILNTADENHPQSFFTCYTDRLTSPAMLA